MKNRFFLLILVCMFQLNLVAQNIGMNSSGALPHQSAMLDVSAPNKGILIPRMTSSQRTAIAAPATGLLVFDTETTSFWFHNGSSWSQLSVGSNGWNLTGNAVINPATHFIGTTDAQPLRFKLNNTWAGEMHPTSGNIFLGLGAGQANTTGEANSAIGDHALFTNTEGSFNTANGYFALSGNTTGYNNTAHGGYALYNNTIGFANTAVGRNALFANSTGSSNTATGVNALLTNTEGSQNTANGSRALYGNTTGFDNTATGYQSLYANTSGGQNTANGSYSLTSNTIGTENSAFGCLALAFNTTGINNTAIGYAALASNETGNSNTAIGFRSLYSGNATVGNTATGHHALYSATGGSLNTANGIFALERNIDGHSNTAIGGYALRNNSPGNSNTAVGYFSLYQNINGFQNTAVGVSALSNNTTGINNTAIGHFALENNTTGRNNIAIGVGAGTAPGGNAPNIFNTISIGNDDLLNAFQNQVIIGNSSTAWIGGRVGWSILSDARIKNTITEDVKGLDFILRLRPITYHISSKAITSITGNKETPDFPGKYDGEKIKYTGFLAQEVEQAAQAIGYDFSGYHAPKDKTGLYSLSYEQFVVPLVKAMQEQQVIITNQQKQIELLEKRLTALENKR